MLLNLHVKNLALIEEADVYFRNGLNIMTGETGAGKSIIIGSMNLALGGKLSKDFVRKEADEAFVELVFDLDNERQRELLQAISVEAEDGQVVLSRRILAGRSIAKINGQTANATRLREVASVLLDMHGQHEHQSLLQQRHQLELVDLYGKAEIGPQKQLVREAFLAYQNAKKALDGFVVDERERQREVSFLEFEIQEIETAAPVCGEDEELERLYKKLSNGKRITEAVQAAHQLTGYDALGAGDLIGRACHVLYGVEEFDDALGELSGQMQELDGLLNDWNRALASYQQTLEFGEEEFYQTEKRLDELNHLKSKYGQSIEEVLEGLGKRKERLAALEEYEERKAQLEEAKKRAKEKYLKDAGKLTKLRESFAMRLAEQICTELQSLNFLDVRLEIALTPTEGATAEGMDVAEFLISTNPGEPLRPLSMVASGGELSRIMLAIKVVLAGQDVPKTLVFDEIDTGISGRTAQMVSEKMAKIAGTHQVICITHLPQIASMADTHFLIEKGVESGATISHIRRLSSEETIEELSRMVGGAQITEAVRNHAGEMKRLANAYKTSLRA